MKSVIKENKPESFPKIMKHKISKIIVLFISPTVGMALNKAENYSVGKISDQFTLDTSPQDWDYYRGEVVLSND